MFPHHPSIHIHIYPRTEEKLTIASSLLPSVQPGIKGIPKTSFILCYMFWSSATFNSRGTNGVLIKKWTPSWRKSGSIVLDAIPSSTSIRLKLSGPARPWKLGLSTHIIIYNHMHMCIFNKCTHIYLFVFIVNMQISAFFSQWDIDNYIFV